MYTSEYSCQNFTAYCGYVEKIYRTLIPSADPVEQEKRIKYTSLVANIGMLHNVVDLTKSLNNMVDDDHHVTPLLAQKLSPYMTKNTKCFEFILDMETASEPFDIPELVLAKR